EEVERHRGQLAELRKSLVSLYEMANRAERRMIIENVWPNRQVTVNGPCFEPYDWVVVEENDASLLRGTLERDTGRTLIELFNDRKYQQRSKDDI
ncbi:MAG: hypothetical protein AAGL17_18880, partial [Cyanobacteria bacterium J06576_12]